uniref:Ig-like domain-containing protein n=1 Tax=Steinernema glaseri TaxID=37863 RepID=A0A1I8ATJ8_9BILA
MWTAVLVLFALMASSRAQFHDAETGEVVRGCPPGRVGYIDFGFRVHLECDDEGNQVLIGCTINGTLYEAEEEVTINSIRNRMCIQKPRHFIRNEILGCVTDDGQLLDRTETIVKEDGTEFGCHIRRSRGGRIVSAKWFKKYIKYGDRP